jgi:hypothetical protein
MIKLGKVTSEKEIKYFINLRISEKERKYLINLMKEYRNVFSFTTDDLKEYREDVIQHTIPLKQDVKPFKQKSRQINPKLSPMM